MTLKGQTKSSNPYANSAGKTLKNSPYGKLPESAKKKAKKATGSKDAETTDDKPGEGVALKDVFNVLADENGRVTSAKLRSLVKELDLEFSDKEIREMIDVVDPTGKGEISYNNLVGIVRDFSHEFPQVQLTTEELSRELTDEIVTAEDNTTEPNEEQSNSDAQSKTENSTEEQEEEQLQRPLSSKCRVAANARKIMEEIDDKMSVIKEDDEPEDEENGEENDEEKEIEKDKEEKGGEMTADKKERSDDDEQENTHETENEEENVEKEQVVDCDEKTEDNKSLNSIAGTLIEPNPDDYKNSVVDDSSNVRYTDDEYTREPELDAGRLSTVQSRASTVKQYRLDSGVSTAVGRMDVIENGRQSRKRSTSNISNTSRRDSMKSESRQKFNSTERSNSKSRKRDTGRKSLPHRKSFSADDPEFYSTMGCSLKLSQIRTRQRLLYIMWRAVYDQAVRKMQQEQARQKTQKKKLKNVKQNPSVSAI